MPWTETCAMDERIRFVLEATAPGVVMTKVCARLRGRLLGTGFSG